MSTPELVCELNELWASEGRPFRLGKHGIGQLWAVRGARGEAGQPLLFIVGREERAVAPAHAWANRAATAGASTVPAPLAARAAGRLPAIGVHEIGREQDVGAAGQQDRPIDLAAAEARLPAFRHGVADERVALALVPLEPREQAGRQVEQRPGEAAGEALHRPGRGRRDGPAESGGRGIAEIERHGSRSCSEWSDGPHMGAPKAAATAPERHLPEVPRRRLSI